MKTMNITFDLETCALCPNTAVMSIGAVAWDPNAGQAPFLEFPTNASPYCFLQHIDLRSSFLDGFTFDQATSDWWSRQSEEARQAVLDNDETPLLPVDEVVKNFFAWIAGVKGTLHLDDVYLWSQGTDFDMAILRNICYKYGLEIPVHYRNFRDHRTFFLEGASLVCFARGVAFSPTKAYSLVESYDDVEHGAKHDPLYDCKRSIFATWQMMKRLRCLTAHQQ